MRHILFSCLLLIAALLACSSASELGFANLAAEFDAGDQIGAVTVCGNVPAFVGGFREERTARAHANIIKTAGLTPRSLPEPFVVDLQVTVNGGAALAPGNGHKVFTLAERELVVNQFNIDKTNCSVWEADEPIESDWPGAVMFGAASIGSTWATFAGGNKAGEAIIDGLAIRVNDSSAFAFELSSARLGVAGVSLPEAAWFVGGANLATASMFDTVDVVTSNTNGDGVKVEEQYQLSVARAFSAAVYTHGKVFVAGGITAVEPVTEYQIGESELNSELSDTRATGHYEFLPEGIRIWTDGSTSTDKVAEYILAGNPRPLPETGSMEWNGTANKPGLQILFDVDGTVGNKNDWNILVGESVYGDNWWLTGSSSSQAKEAAPSTQGGSGSTWSGTLAQWRSALPNARVLAFGFSLGSGVKGDGVIRSLSFGDDTYLFTSNKVNANSTVTFSNVVDVFDVATGKRSSIELPGPPRAFLTAVATNDFVFFAGGVVAASYDSSYNVIFQNTTDVVDVYHVKSGLWQSDTLMGGARMYAGAVAVPNSNVALIAPGSYYPVGAQRNYTSEVDVVFASVQSSASSLTPMALVSFIASFFL